MATVKLQDGKVILKNGKVSCSCCAEPECCMYPAQALADGLYSADDLPDAVILNYDLVEDFELTRSGSEFIGGIYKIALGTLPNSTETQWLLYVNNERDNNNPCLITGDGGLTPGDDIVEDQFADTYTIQYTLDGTQFTRTLTRRDLCCWDSGGTGDENGAAMRYLNNNVTEKPEWRWIVGNCFLGFGGGLKQGNQNSPVGTYSSNEGITTIS